jgi:peptide/nickel transport system permease protein
MLRYLSGRAAGALAALFGVTLLSFFTAALIPGNPAYVLLGSYATPDRVAALTRDWGLDAPLPIRYLTWLRHALAGDLGESVFSKQPVTAFLANSLPVTLELSLMALTLALAVAIPLGLLLAFNSRRWWSRPLMLISTVGVSIPGFWTGLLLVLLFAVKLQVLPSGGYVAFTEDPAGNLTHMALPTLTLAMFLAPPLVRYLRSSAVAILSEPYVKTARSKGISTARLLTRHVAPNALIPMLTFLGLQIGTLISGAIVTEVIFALPGMGRLGLDAILNRDYALVQGVVLVVAAGYVVTNLAVDLLYGLVDPRIRVRT